MQWDLLFVQSTIRLVSSALIMLALNVLAVWLSIYILKKKDFNYKGYTASICFLVIFLDYGYYSSFTEEADILYKYKNGHTEIIEGKIERCELLRGNKGGHGAAEISIDCSVLLVDNFIEWHPCKYLFKERKIRATYVRALGSRRVAVKLETQRPS